MSFAPSSPQDLSRDAAFGIINPVSVTFLNLVLWGVLGFLAQAAELGAFAAVGLGWIGGSALTVALVAIYALYLPPETDTEGDTYSDACADAAGQDGVIWTWDKDRAQDLARDAAIRAWEEDNIADLSPHSRHPGLPLA